MVRQFGALNVQNILYLQAELVALEYDFRKLEAANDAQQDGRGGFSLDWDATDVGRQDWWKWRSVEDGSSNKAKLKEYSGHVPNPSSPHQLIADETVLQYSQMLALSKPQNRNLENLQEWMRRPTMGKIYLAGPWP